MSDFINKEENEKKNIYSYDIEKRVIAKMMEEGSAGLNADLAINWVKSDYFFDTTFRELFNIMYILRSEGKPVDILTVRNEILNRSTNPEVKKQLKGDVEAAEFYKNLTEYSAFSSDLKSDCDILYDKYLTRTIKNKCEEVIKKCYDSSLDSETILTETQSEFFNLAQNRDNIDFADGKIVMRELLERINAAAQTPDGITGIRSGINSLDKKTSGFQKGNLIILAARPSIGKTTLALNIAYNTSKKGNKVAFFSLEMSALELYGKLLSMDASISTEKIRSGKFNDNDWQLVLGGGDVKEGSISRVITPNIKVNDTARSPIDIKNKCLKLKSENNLDLVVIDYLQLMNDNSKKFNSRYEEVSSNSRSLKLLAKELNVPIIALSQVSRNADGTEPRLSDLRESGAIEQDADIVMFLHDENKAMGSKAARMDIPKEKLKLIIAKHRNGETGSIDLHFSAQTSRFADWQGN